MKRIGIALILCVIMILVISIVGVSCGNGADNRAIVRIAPCDSQRTNENYKLRYRIIYDDSTSRDEWVQVTKAEYDSYEALKNSGG